MYSAAAAIVTTGEALGALAVDTAFAVSVTLAISLAALRLFSLGSLGAAAAVITAGESLGALAVNAA